MNEQDIYIPISVIKNYTVSMTPTEFEELVEDYVLGLGKDLTDLNVTHNERIKAEDGTYQIDVLATYKAFGTNMKVLIECKQYKSPVKREKVQVLYDKIRALGAQKAIMFSTADYQEGAIKFAIVHGIALIRVLPGSIQFITNSISKFNIPPEYFANAPKFVAECTYERFYGVVKKDDLYGLSRYLKLPSTINKFVQL